MFCRCKKPARLPPRLAAHTPAPHSAAGCRSPGRSFCRRAWPRTSRIGRGADIVASSLPSRAAAYVRCRYVAPFRCHTSLPARWPSRLAALRAGAARGRPMPLAGTLVRSSRFFAHPPHGSLTPSRTRPPLLCGAPSPLLAHDVRMPAAGTSPHRRCRYGEQCRNFIILFIYMWRLCADFILSPTRENFILVSDIYISWTIITCRVYTSYIIYMLLNILLLAWLLIFLHPFNFWFDPIILDFNYYGI